MKRFYIVLFLLSLILLGQTATSPSRGQAVYAQDAPRLSLRLNRDFGSSFGTRIAGTFSFRVDAPDEVVRVTFFIDDIQIGEDSEAPYRLQFRTSNFEIGLHTISAVGYTQAGEELISNQLRREFISSASSTNRTLWIVIPILILSLSGRYISSRIANKDRRKTGKTTMDGPLGGTICPKCHKPFAIHLWSFKLVTVRGDRCPHCGKWSIVHRMHPDLLNASLDAMETTASDTKTFPKSDDSDLQQKLDESRFE